MRHQCPGCSRQFDEPGFCPFDRTQLVAVADRPATPDQKTILSAAIAAQPSQPPDSHKTEVDRRGTFPLTPGQAAPVPAPSTQDLTSARKRPAPASENRIRAVSASENPAEALEAFRAGHDSEYDRLVGQTLDGRYYVEKKIGEGGMGVVFAARHAVIERPLAIKVLKREVMRDTATIRRFVQEAKAASRIGHPNIVDVTDFGTTPDGMTYSVMEYVTGDTLGAALRAAAPFAVLRAVRIAAQIARALGAAHDKGIVHRDLKPENVFLIDRDGRTDFVKIVDFGIAKVTPVGGGPQEPRLTRAGSVFGTPEYMAPEQAAGRSDTDGRVDVYALGVILYEMLCGKVPHKGDSMVRTLAMQMLDPATPPSQVRPDLAIPAELEAVVMKALAKKREARYQTMGELLLALDKVQKEVLPPPIAQSVTGSPVYSLTPLPPGADAHVVRSQPPVPIQSSSPQIAVPAISAPHPMPVAPTTSRHEPQFVTTDKPMSFEHVYEEPVPVAAPRRWPWLLLGALVIGGAAGAVGFALKGEREEPVAITEHRDAAVVIPVVADANQPPADAAIPLAADAADLADAAIDIIIEADAGVRYHPTRHVDAGTSGPITTPNHRGTIIIQVLSKPETATLYVGTSYRGPSGTQLEEAFGNHVTVECRQAGYKPGKVELSFDGKTEVVLCVLERIKICINNIKNPFDDCEIDPNQAPPSP